MHRKMEKRKHKKHRQKQIWKMGLNPKTKNLNVA